MPKVSVAEGVLFPKLLLLQDKLVLALTTLPEARNHEHVTNSERHLSLQTGILVY